ncbi:hypothetical protein OY671_009576, partial [Metschnikowia pulcherrima]
EGAAGPDPQLLEDHGRRAKAGEAGSKHVRAGKGRQPEETGVNPMGQGKAGEHDHPGETENR